MTTPLLILMVISAVAGFLTIGGEFQTWVYGALPDPHDGKFHWSWGIFLGSTALALVSGFAAYAFIHHRDRIRSWGIGGIWPIPEAQKFATELFYLDSLAENFLARRVFYRWIAQGSAWFDERVVDGVVNRAWREGLTVSSAARFVQNGWVQAGTLSIGLGGMIIWIAVVLF
ncbi:MAG: hypothetical protein F4102_08560 [Chloroflexi bacterium]|nr:hypothetical protein [Chloroflexota bacterium]